MPVVLCFNADIKLQTNFFTKTLPLSSQSDFLYLLIT